VPYRTVHAAVGYAAATGKEWIRFGSRLIDACRGCTILRRSRTVIGWLAIAGLNALCDGDACVIADSQAAMRKLVARRTTRDALSMKWSFFGSRIVVALAA